MELSKIQLIVKQSSVLHSMCEIAIIPFLNQKKICFTVYYGFNSLWQINITGCVMQSLAEWKFGSANVPPRPMAARLTRPQKKRRQAQ